MIHFTKMHGIGNDYLYVDATTHDLSAPEALARAMSDRHVGVGADGLILLLRSDDGVAAHLRMRIFNADGSEAEMCGNGIRCACKYACERGLAQANPMRIQTAAGVLELQFEADAEGRVHEVTVDMGRPELELSRIPVDPAAVEGDGPLRLLSLGEFAVQFVPVSMGNPHAVIFADEWEQGDLARLGPAIESHPAFPNRVNVHLVQVRREDEVTMCSWERGSGATLACGTGACAVCVAGVLVGRTGRRLRAHLPGGDLLLHWDETSDHVLMTGPATEVFDGTWPVAPARIGAAP